MRAHAEDFLCKQGPDLHYTFGTNRMFSNTAFKIDFLHNVMLPYFLLIAGKFITIWDTDHTYFYSNIRTVKTS